jgi:FG-GAP repeat
MRRFARLMSAVPIALLLWLPGSATALEQKFIAPTGAALDQFGFSVAIDGDTAVIGAPDSDGKRGSVFVYVRSGDAWIYTAKLTASDGASGDHLGWSVAIDGDTIVAGAPYDRVDGEDWRGSVYTFTRSGPATRAETAKLAASDGSANDLLGWSVAIDGDTLVAGAPQEKFGPIPTGAVYLFSRTGGAVRTETALLTASNRAENDQLGSSVAIDGDVIVAGAPYHDAGSTANVGMVYTFARTGLSMRSETAQLSTVLGAAWDELGRSVAVSGDTIVAGAPRRDVLGKADRGVVYTFTRTGEATRVQSGALTASDGAADDQLGGSTAIEGDTIIAGAAGDDVDTNIDQGSAYTFTRGGAPGRTEAAKLTDAHGATGDACGISVAADAGSLLIGAYQDDEQSNADQGSASTFFEPQPASGSANGPGDGPGADLTAPVLTRLRLTNGRISYVLSEPATVRLRVQRARRRHGFLSLRGALAHTSVAGRNSVRFSGRLRGRTLRPGRYRLIATPTDPTGNRGIPRRAGFRVIRRKAHR